MWALSLASCDCPEMFVSLPELPSCAAAVIQMLGDPPLLPKLQEPLTLTCTPLSPYSSSAQERGEALNRVMTRNCGKNLSKAEVVEGHTQIRTCILFEVWQLVKSEMGGGGREEKLKKKSTKNVQDSERTIRSYICLCTYLWQNNSSQMIAHMLAKHIN